MREHGKLKYPRLSKVANSGHHVDSKTGETEFTPNSGARRGSGRNGTPNLDRFVPAEDMVVPTSES